MDVSNLDPMLDPVSRLLQAQLLPFQQKHPRQPQAVLTVAPPFPMQSPVPAFDGQCPQHPKQQSARPQPQQRARRQQFHGSDEPKVVAAVNKGIICQQFFHRRRCELAPGTCPYAHIVDGEEHPIPERVCHDWCESECMKEGCRDFHATAIQLQWLRDTAAVKGTATYKPQDYMLVRQPMVPLSWRAPQHATSRSTPPPPPPSSYQQLSISPNAMVMPAFCFMPVLGKSCESATSADLSRTPTARSLTSDSAEFAEAC